MLEPENSKPNLQEILARVVSGRNRNPDLSLDADVASCQILAALAGGGALPEDAFNRLVAHNRALIKAPADELMGSLSRQSLLLESLWLHFSARAAAEARPDRAASFVKAALGLQRALLNVQGVVHQMSEERRDAEALEPA